jgi:phospholipid transport system substrate-binding protein
MRTSNRGRTRGRRLFVRGIAAALLAAVPLPSPATDGAAPRAVVRETTDAVLAVLSRDDLSTPEKRSKIEDIVYERFDFRTVSRLVLARNWKRLSAKQQDEFVHEFKKHLSITYGNNIDDFNDEEVAITGDRAEARGDWTVKTKVVRKNAEDVVVDYRLRRKKDIWRVIDVVVEGVSMVANFRSQFRDIVSREGPDNLIEMLREKNEKGESLNEA